VNDECNAKGFEGVEWHDGRHSSFVILQCESAVDSGSEAKFTFAPIFWQERGQIE